MADGNPANASVKPDCVKSDRKPVRRDPFLSGEGLAFQGFGKLTSGFEGADCICATWLRAAAAEFNFACPGCVCP